ncbi:UDP-N-acetylmuramoyl-tripeptide--D-alanyl-D-alanine ligase [Clostridium sp. NSJ-145]|uniref:UDP-N-acetylmuramoyl-tripeptide--D-alanyl-D- alanine ligase n=1 Tax=Clostridium sp. NSJ-145 TaxID=2897777 RepID=UPI001E616701|nr:UDP-N-acetylmuramoyl-tripeptide--D-alanyl-D-alanine ligase [Clostridium sp. NSJ-145]MCD2500238.1 UDP-N-acetylmuramoyl-tripeptide--D-alanyl-D-alanine ligase [Clostridium sp. NSJ-145]MDU6340362.1 UDP-N-acetylmuramoyl-tripeptide--D-alanyl-D-alanine ligase [Clostridium sp.]
MEITFKELLDAIKGEIIIDSSKKEFNKFCIDTRKIEEGNIFVALKGEKFNPNKNAIEAIDKGANIVLVDEVFFDKADIKKEGTIIKVESCHKALLDLANYYRKKLNLKVIGVTGSTGKTSTKDLVAAFLSHKFKVFKTKGNFNSEIGLPLMIFELTSEYDVAVLEMGMSDLGEIHNLAKTALPDMAVITNIGLSHLENLKTQENILKAKMEITDFFDKDSVLVVNGEDRLLNKLDNKCFKIEKTGYNHEYDVYATNIILRENSTEFTAHHKGNEFTFKLPMAGKHNVLNSMLAIDIALNLGLSFEDMNKGLENLEATSMRLQVIKKENITIINDCYNASPDSMKSSLDVLATYNGGRKVAILGDMYELGSKSKEAHAEVGSYATDKVELLIVIGENIEEFRSGYKGKSIVAFKTKDECLDKLKDYINKNDIILVKASRGMKFEEVVNELESISIY